MDSIENLLGQVGKQIDDKFTIQEHRIVGLNDEVEELRNKISRIKTALIDLAEGL